MKTSYLFCHCPGIITPDTVFVKVSVGHSKQDQRDIKYLTLLAQCTDYFLYQYDNDAAKFFDKVKHSLYETATGYESRTSSLYVTLTVGEVRRLLRSGQFDEFTQNFRRIEYNCLAMFLSRNYCYAIARERAAHNPCNAAHVKNLSHGRAAV